MKLLNKAEKTSKYAVGADSIRPAVKSSGFAAGIGEIDTEYRVGG